VCPSRSLCREYRVSPPMRGERPEKAINLTGRQSIPSRLFQPWGFLRQIHIQSVHLVTNNTLQGNDTVIAITQHANQWPFTDTTFLVVWVVAGWRRMLQGW